MLKRYIEGFWARKLTTYQQFFCRPACSKVLSLSDSNQAITFPAGASFHLKTSWIGWIVNSAETLCRGFLCAKFDNVATTFIANQLGQKFFPSQTLFRRSHSYLGAHFLKRSMARLKSKLCWNAILEGSLAQKLTTYKHFFVEQLCKNWCPLGVYTRTHILPRPSFQLNKSLTRMKRNLYWNTI